MVPDVPVSKFALTIFGGKRGLLLNSSRPLRQAADAESLAARPEQQDACVMAD